jgi:type I restriction enzyme R subunit
MRRWPRLATGHHCQQAGSPLAIAPAAGVRQTYHRRYGILKRGRKWDLSKIDFEELKKDFKKSAYRNIEIADLRAFIEKKLQEMLSENRTRIGFLQRLQEIVDRYNAGGSSNEAYFEALTAGFQKVSTHLELNRREPKTVSNNH